MIRFLFSILSLIIISLSNIFAQNYKSYRVLQAHDATVTFVTMRNEDNLLATGDKMGNILIWDIEKEKVVKRLEAHKKEITHLEFSQKGNILASASYDGTIKIWDIETFEIGCGFNLMYKAYC